MNRLNKADIIRKTSETLKKFSSFLKIKLIHKKIKKLNGEYIGN